MDKIIDVLNSLSIAIDKNTKELSKIKDLNQKKVQAEIIKLLCESLGVFLDAMNNGSVEIDDEEEYDSDIPF